MQQMGYAHIWFLNDLLRIVWPQWPAGIRQNWPGVGRHGVGTLCVAQCS